MEASAFVREVADGCWAAGIRDPGRSAKANPHNPPKRVRAQPASFSGPRQRDALVAGQVEPRSGAGAMVPRN
jgi:hypothetical protein